MPTPRSTSTGRPDRSSRQGKSARRLAATGDPIITRTLTLSMKITRAPAIGRGKRRSSSWRTHRQARAEFCATAGSSRSNRDAGGRHDPARQFEEALSDRGRGKNAPDVILFIDEITLHCPRGDRSTAISTRQHPQAGAGGGNHPASARRPSRNTQSDRQRPASTAASAPSDTRQQSVSESLVVIDSVYQRTGASQSQDSAEAREAACALRPYMRDGACRQGARSADEACARCDPDSSGDETLTAARAKSPRRP